MDAAVTTTSGGYSLSEGEVGHTETKSKGVTSLWSSDGQGWKAKNLEQYEWKGTQNKTGPSRGDL